MEAQGSQVTWPRLRSQLAVDPVFDTRWTGCTVSAVNGGDQLSLFPWDCLGSGTGKKGHH